jgi:hypothetical protein
MTLDLDELGRIASAATPGPWRVRTNRHTTTSGEEWGWVSHMTTQNISLPGMSINWEAPTGHANATHIAVFNPVTVLALIARARDAERLEAVMRSVHETLSQSSDDIADDARLTIEFALMVPEPLSALNEGGPANG